LDYTDTIALVTGASRGFGYAVAAELARRGAHVVAVARTIGGLEELADEIDKTSGASTLVPLDITDENGIKRMCRAIHDRWGRLDLWVHCAAHAVPLSPVDHTSLKDFDKAWAVNARATLSLVTNIQPLLKAAPQGQAVFMRDPHTGPKFFTGYAVSRNAQTKIAEAWAEETMQIGPKVTFFAPEPMPTALRHRFFPGENRDALTPCATEAERLVASL
jgi:NAD(P)-dependent dehydrogenase (short-subunit alcohol dehydrogenase family)